MGLVVAPGGLTASFGSGNTRTLLTGRRAADPPVQTRGFLGEGGGGRKFAGRGKEFSGDNWRVNGERI